MLAEVPTIWTAGRGCWLCLRYPMLCDYCLLHIDNLMQGTTHVSVMFPYRIPITSQSNRVSLSCVRRFYDAESVINQLARGFHIPRLMSMQFSIIDMPEICPWAHEAA